MTYEGVIVLDKMRAFHAEHGYIVIGSPVAERMEEVHLGFMVFPGERATVPVKCIGPATLQDAQAFAAACGTEIVSPAPFYLKAVVAD